MCHFSNSKFLLEFLAILYPPSQNTTNTAYTHGQTHTTWRYTERAQMFLSV